ncbi:MAG TPA: DUF4203 domain-containing protein [Ktedonobacteraceae bacterium]|nr:DUF4203 domain-containing protein [Ktedonobacteraceae bacterium]
MLNVLIAGIIALLIGIAFCFAGYRFFRILIAIWGFLAGFLLTAQAFAISSNGHFLVSIVGLVIALIVGLVFALLAYYLYVAAVVILCASVGFWVGTGLMTAFGFGIHSGPALIVGIIFAILLALLTLALNLAKFFIIIITAFGGASTIITGVLLLLRVIPLDYLSLGVVGAIIRGSLLWSLIWLILAIVGIIAQLSSTQQYAQEYARSQF